MLDHYTIAAGSALAGLIFYYFTGMNSNFINKIPNSLLDFLKEHNGHYGIC